MKITLQEKQLILKRRIKASESSDIDEYTALLSQSMHGLDTFSKLFDKANKFAKNKFHEDLMRKVQQIVLPIIKQKIKLEKDVRLAIESINSSKLKIGN